MKHSNKKGFTLMEMMVVVAIILFIAGVTVYGVKDYMDKANSWKAEVAEHGDMYDRCQSDVDGYLVGFTRATTASETTDNTPHPGPGPGGNPSNNPGGGGGGNPTTPDNPTAPDNPTTPDNPSDSSSDPTTPDNQNAPGSDYNYRPSTNSDFFSSDFKFIEPVREFKVTTDGGNFQVNANGMYTVERVSENEYIVKFVADSWASPIKNVPFHVDDGYTTLVIEEWK